MSTMSPGRKYSSAGTRRVRLLTDQKGFSVAYAFVSSVKAAPPRDAEVKDLEKARVEAAAGAPRPSSDASLVGWWRLDEKTGATASDSTRNRNHGALRNGPAWAAGKLGGALQLDGADDHVRIPDSPSINTIGAQMTVAVWIERQADQSDYRLVVSRRTLSHRKHHRQPLSADESDRLARVLRVLLLAEETFQSPDKALAWLRRQNRALQGSVPLELLDTGGGARAVETVLGRLAHGVYA